MISINVTVYNKESLIRRVLLAIELFTESPHEIVIVLDGCKDKSEEVVNNFFELNRYIPHKILHADNVFETKANNIAAKNSSGDYIIIVQDDTLVNEWGWDRRLIAPMLKYDDVVSVSGNCAHDWAYNPNNKAEKLDYFPDNWWCDILIPTNIVFRTEAPRNVFTVRMSSNRSPLAINHKDLEALGYFDEAFAPQQDDDHDFHYRAYEQLGKVTGICPVEIISKPEWGSTRNQGELPWLLKATHKNQKLMWARHKELILNPRKGETRPL
jgi:glycosyltransferase involved in cell wall biosynthesis